MLASFNNTNGANLYAGRILSCITLYGMTYTGLTTCGVGTVFALVIPTRSAAALLGLGGLVIGCRRR